jgi:hypothetical protein
VVLEHAVERADDRAHKIEGDGGELSEEDKGGAVDFKSDTM